MKVEVADRKNMYSMCVATIVDVIGDRLRMRYDGLDDDVAEDFWCHYQSSEIHPIGWSSLVGHTLQPPIGKFSFMNIRYGVLGPLAQEGERGPYTRMPGEAVVVS